MKSFELIPRFSELHINAIGAEVLLVFAMITAMIADGLAAEPGYPPNVIVILTDDQRYDELGYTGHPVIKTPHINALAKEGVRFGSYFTTTAVCLPSRTTLVTGQWERAHTVGFSGERALSSSQWADSLFMVLKRAGYFTGLIGKSNIPGLRQTDLDYYCASDKTYLGFYPRKQHWEFDALFHGAEAETQIEIIGEAAEDFLGVDQGFYKRSLPQIQPYLGRRPKSKPFFLLLGFEVPHGTGTRTMVQSPTDNYVRVFGEVLPDFPSLGTTQRATGDELYRSAYRDQTDQMPIPANYVSWQDFRTPKLPLSIYNGEQSPSYGYRSTPEGVREQQVRTCQTITGVDRLLGRLRERLEQLGIADNTILIFTSDHGLMHGEWGYGGKCLVYEPAIHVPLILYDPRASTGHGLLRDELAVSPDVAPTILELCGLKPPASMQGRSLAPLIRGEDVPWREDIFLECLMLTQNYPLVQAVRGKRWKYMRYWPFQPVPIDYRDVLNRGLRGEDPAYEELFDLQEDPTEQQNLAGNPAQAGQLAKMRLRCVELLRESLGRRPEAALPSSRLDEWQEETKDYYEVVQRARQSVDRP